MAPSLRIGVAGCGKIAERAHAPGFKKAKGGAVVALFDVDRAKAAALAKTCEIDATIYTDWKEFLGAGLDAVAVCSPNRFHYSQTMDALKAGLHVLCEKPMAASLEEATRMVNAAKKAGRVLHINQSLRYNAMYVTLAETVKKGTIGDVIHMRCIRGSTKTPDKGWSPGASWFVSGAEQGGLLLDIGIHMSDVLKWLAGDVKEIAACLDTRTPGIDVPDNVNALFRFESGATAMLELSWTFATGTGLGPTEVYGTKGTIRAGYSAEAPIEVLKPDRKGLVKTTYPRIKQRVPNGFQSFVDAVRGRRPSPTPGELGRDALAMCDAIRRSEKSRKFEKVKKY